MSITNTIATYLIILAYINFTKFENLIKYCCCRPRLTSLSLWRLVNKRFLRGRIRKDSSLFFFTFFSPGPCFFSFFFFFFFFLRRGLFVFFFFGGGPFFCLWSLGFFLLFFFLGGGSFCCCFLGPVVWVGGGSGTPWVVTSALQGYYQIILVVNGRWVILGEGTNHHYFFLAHHVALKLRCWHLQFHDLQLKLNNASCRTGTFL